MSSSRAWIDASPPEMFGYPDDEILCKHGIGADAYCSNCHEEAAEYERATGQPIIGDIPDEIEDLPY